MQKIKLNVQTAANDVTMQNGSFFGVIFAHGHFVPLYLVCRCAEQRKTAETFTVGDHYLQFQYKITKTKLFHITPSYFIHR